VYAVRTIPLTLAQANELISAWHRHHKPAQGHRYSIGARSGMDIVGAAIVGRPVARKTDQYLIAEVTRLVTNGAKNACSFLYAASARVAREMGFERIQTFILADEPGTSLEAAGWMFEGMTDSAPQKWHTRPGRRTDQPAESKQRWYKDLTR
jgi:hypothetical protein